MDIFQLITDITTDNNISYDNLEKYNGGFMKLNIYNPTIPIPMHKFWFFIENVKIIKITNNIIEIALSDIYNKTLIDYINKIESKIQQYINDNIVKKNILKNTIEKVNVSFPIMKIKINENSILYNENDELIEQHSLQQNNIVNIFIELNNIIINKNIYQSWLSFDIIQIKQNKLYDIKKSFFIKKNIPPPPPPHHTLPKLEMSNNTKNKITEKPQITRLNISTNDIVSQLGKLKKTNYNTNNNTNDITNDIVVEIESIAKPLNEPSTKLIINEPPNETLNNELNNEPIIESLNNEPIIESFNNKSIIESLNIEPISDSSNNESNNDIKKKKKKKIHLICDNEMKEKHEKISNVMDEMINKIKKNKKIKINKDM